MTDSSANSSLVDMDEYVYWEWSRALSDEHVNNDDSNKNDTQSNIDTEHIRALSDVNDDVNKNDTQSNIDTEDICALMIRVMILIF